MDARSVIKRTRIACDNCKRKRIKCSGQPGPCTDCRQGGKFCHFHPRLDARRKDCVSASEVAKKSKALFRGLLLILKSNTDEDVRELIGTFRAPKPSAVEIADCFHRQLRLLQTRGEIGSHNISQDDIISLALSEVVDHRTITSKSVGIDYSDRAFGHDTSVSSDHHPTHIPVSGSASGNSSPDLSGTETDQEEGMKFRDMTKSNKAPAHTSFTALHRGYATGSPTVPSSQSWTNVWPITPVETEASHTMYENYSDLPFDSSDMMNIHQHYPHFNSTTLTYLDYLSL